MKFILKLIGSVLLVILALILFIAVTPCALLWRIVVTVFGSGKYNEFGNGVYRYFVQIAASYDQLGNAVFGGFWNWLFIRNAETRYYSFGNKDETISEVLGWNEHLKTLSKSGTLFVKFLNKLDKDHCARAARTGIDLAKTKLHNVEKYGL